VAFLKETTDSVQRWMFHVTETVLLTVSIFKLSLIFCSLGKSKLFLVCDITDISMATWVLSSHFKKHSHLIYNSFSATTSNTELDTFTSGQHSLIPLKASFCYT